MQSWIKEWAKNKTMIIQRTPFTAQTLDDIHAFVGKSVSQNLNPVVSERTTSDGFYMGLHRDDYHLDNYKFKKGVRDESVWSKMYDTEKRPMVTVIWYRSTQGIDFVGGNLRFHDGYTVRPVKDSAILFDSNDIHEVTLQTRKEGLPNTRTVVIIKYYDIAFKK